MNLTLFDGRDAWFDSMTRHGAKPRSERIPASVAQGNTGRHYYLVIARGNLKKNDYVSAAFEFVDEHGLESLTMRSLGEKMGVDPTAVYRHFPTKDSLINGVVDKFMGEVVRAAPSSDDMPARDRIIAFAVALREQFRKHPHIGSLIPNSSGESADGLEASGRVLRAMRDLGLRGENLIVAYQMMEGFVLGSCIQDFTAAPRNWEIRRLRYRMFDVAEIDALTSTADAVRHIGDTAFLAGVNLLLDAALERTNA